MWKEDHACQAHLCCCIFSLLYSLDRLSASALSSGDRSRSVTSLGVKANRNFWVLLSPEPGSFVFLPALTGAVFAAGPFAKCAVCSFKNCSASAAETGSVLVLNKQDLLRRPLLQASMRLQEPATLDGRCRARSGCGKSLYTFNSPLSCGEAPFGVWSAQHAGRHSNLLK